VVTGPVNLGDYILPNGINSGRGVAVAPDKMNVTDFKNIVGIAWTASADKNPKVINVAVGLNGNAINSVVEKQNAALEAQRTRIQELKQSVSARQAVLAKLIPGFDASLAAEQSERAASERTPLDHSTLSNLALDDIATNKSKIPAYIPLTDAKVEAGLELAMKICKDAGYTPDKNPYMKKFATDAAFRTSEVARVKAMVAGKMDRYTELLSRRGEDAK